jgi:hypothetical protein
MTYTIRRFDESQTVVLADGALVATCTGDNREAYARLFAAATGLLEALKAALPYVEQAYECSFPDESENFLVRENAMQAIAKAEGRA